MEYDTIIIHKGKVIAKGLLVQQWINTSAMWKTDAKNYTESFTLRITTDKKESPLNREDVENLIDEKLEALKIVKE